MISSDLIEKGNILLKRHREIFKKLILIPETREVAFRIDIENNLSIGKLRFKNRIYRWSDELLAGLHDHLENVWNFFDLYSHWIDNSLISLLSYRKRTESKKSISYLLMMTTITM